MKYEEERKWRIEAKEKLLKKASKAKTNRSFEQIMKVVHEHTAELVKIDKIMKDLRAW